jgi:hypothetical protein
MGVIIYVIMCHCVCVIVCVSLCVCVVVSITAVGCIGGVGWCEQVAETQRAYEKYQTAVKEAEELELEAASELQDAVDSSVDDWDHD